MNDSLTFSGFVKTNEEPRINVGDVNIYNAFTHQKIANSDAMGFFTVTFKTHRHSVIKVFRKGYEDFVQISFEGFLKHKKDSAHKIKLNVIDLVTGDTLSDHYESGFSNFTLESDKDYSFLATTESGDTVDVEDVKFEGFIKNSNNPYVLQDVKLKDSESEEVLFSSNKEGFFNVDMKIGEEYVLGLEHTYPLHGYTFWFEGFVKSENGADIPNVKITSDGSNDTTDLSSNAGFIGIEWNENQSYSFEVEKEEEKVYRNILKFEGSVQDGDIPVSVGDVQVFDNGPDTLLFETDMFGFFDAELKPDVTYSFLAKRKGDNHQDTLDLKFSGFVRDDRDSMVKADISIYDPEARKFVPVSSEKGYLSMKLEENKVYKVRAIKDTLSKEAKPEEEKVYVHEIEEVEEIKKDSSLMKTDKQDESEVPTIEDLSTDRYVLFSFNQIREKRQYFLVDHEHHHIAEVSHINDKIQILLRDFTLYLNVPFKGKWEKAEDVERYLSNSDLSITRIETFPSIFFGDNSYDLTQEAKSELDKVAGVLKEFHGLVLMAKAFTDPRGTAQYNFALSQKRARAVIQYLKSKGVDESRLKASAQGIDQENVNCEACKKDYNLSRRTDLIIIHKNALKR
jgi:outer membrane protein OmpA-like peptidoglycan-associated protein